MTTLAEKIAALPEWPPEPFSDAEAERFAHQPPCFLCGYNGSGYFQPSKHKCAERWHSHTYYDDEVRKVALARLALLRETLQAMVDDCKTCLGNGTMTMPIMSSAPGQSRRPCPRCADARRVLEATQ